MANMTVAHRAHLARLMAEILLSDPKRLARVAASDRSTLSGTAPGPADHTIEFPEPLTIEADDEPGALWP